MSVNYVMIPTEVKNYTPAPTKIVEYPDRYVYTYKEPASTGKKIGVGVASYFMTGLGQVINGDWKKGLALWLGGLGASILAIVPIMNTYQHLSMDKKTLLNLTKMQVGGLACIIGIAAYLGIKLASIIDAVKNATKETHVPVIKDDAKVQQKI